MSHWCHFETINHERMRVEGEETVLMKRNKEDTMYFILYWEIYPNLAFCRNIPKFVECSLFGKSKLDIDIRHLHKDDLRTNLWVVKRNKQNLARL